jgi:hypothetical protein
MHLSTLERIFYKEMLPGGEVMGKWFNKCWRSVLDLIVAFEVSKLILFFIAVLLFVHVIFFPSFLIVFILICLFFWLMLF